MFLRSSSSKSESRRAVRARRDPRSQAIGPDVVCHRIVLYEAEAEEVTAEDIVKRVFEAAEVP
jgi:hypothetical protein